MADPVPLPPPGFDALSSEDKLRYVQSLWDRIAANPDEVPIPDWHRAVVSERAAEHARSPDDVVDWTEARKAVEQDIDRPSD